MQPERVTRKPNLPSSSNKKVADSLEDKIHKIDIFFRYRLPSLYRELRVPIYDGLLMKQDSIKKINNKGESKNVTKDLQTQVEMLYKKVALNSKYHHREKMRFQRTPLMKYLKYDFRGLNDKLKSKSNIAIYDDLEDDDEDDDGKEDDKKQYQKDPHFSAQALARYKKKNGINGRIISSKGYDDIKQRLIEKYGWVENQDTTSLMYDYKHMSKKKDIDYVNILDDQVVNHFHENKAVTAKFGLARNIRNVCSLGKDPSIFFPRCFDVNDLPELENFYESFKETYVQSILKKYVAINGCLSSQLSVNDYEKVIQKCIQIVQRRFLKIEQKLVMIDKGSNLFISETEWTLIKKINKLEPTEKANVNINEALLNRAQKVCNHGKKVDPQWNLNKDNIWIVKPASLSRGRGIKTFNDITQIFDYVIGKEISWVAQKYIENPLIIKKRKFDIRQWVLLTDFKPFRVWIYEECYIRFCSTTYEPDNLKDRKIHLTNNSVTKGVSDIIGDGIEENMLSEDQFSCILGEQDGKPIFKNVIRPQMKNIAIETLESVKENMLSRKNTFQIFGFDFMIDEDYKVWLIEVNSSPTMEYSTKVTTKIVRKGMSDLADLVNNYMFKGKYYDKSRAQQLYGGWQLLTNP